jgi:hypothetical protein
MDINNLKIPTVLIPLMEWKKGQGFIEVGEIMHAKERVTKNTVAVLCTTLENDIIVVEPGKPMISGNTVLCHDQEGVFLKTVIIDSDDNRRFVTHPECADIARPLHIFCVFAVATAGIQDVKSRRRG